MIRHDVDSLGVRMDQSLCTESHDFRFVWSLSIKGRGPAPALRGLVAGGDATEWNRVNHR